MSRLTNMDIWVRVICCASGMARIYQLVEKIPNKGLGSVSCWPRVGSIADHFAFVFVQPDQLAQGAIRTILLI